MAGSLFLDGYKRPKKDKDKDKDKTATTKPQSSSSSKPKPSSTTQSVNKTASKSTAMGGGAPTQKVEQAVSKPKSTQKKNPQEAAQNVIQRSTKSTAMGGTPQKVQTSAEKRAERQKNAEDYLNLKQTKIQESKTDNSIMMQRMNRRAKEAQAQKNGIVTAEEAKKREEQREKRRQIGQAMKSGDYDRASKLTGTSQELAAHEAAKFKGEKAKPLSRRAKIEQWDNDIADTVKSTIRQQGAGIARVGNLGMKGMTQKDAYLYTTQEQRDKADAKVAKRDTQLGKVIDDEATVMQKIQDKHGYAGKKVLEATSTLTGMGMDLAANAILPGTGLFFMTARSTGTSLGQVEKKAANLRKQLEQTGQYSKEELDEMFKDVKARDMANATVSGGIEYLSEKMFMGFGPASKYLTEGSSFASKIGGKLLSKAASRLPSGFLGNFVKGNIEEGLEEEAGGRLQTWASNLIYGNKYQSFQEDATKKSLMDESNALRSNIKSEADAQAAAAKLSSKSFMDESIKMYQESGYSKEEATKLAEMSRDYLTASLSGDVDAMKKNQDDMVNIMTGGDRSMKESWGLQDSIDSWITTGLVSLAGVPGSISTAAIGESYKQNMGMGVVRKQAEQIKNISSDPKDKAKAQAVIDHIDKGGDLSGTQVYEIIQKAGEVAEESKQPEGMKNRTAKVEMDKRDLRISPINPDGTLAPQTQQRFERIVEDTVSRHETLARLSGKNRSEYENEEAEDFVGPATPWSKRRLGEDSAKEEADVLIGANIGAAFKVGAINADMVNELARGSDTVKEVFREVTGIDVSQFSSYEEMNNSLMAEAADNLVNSARLEQIAWNDESRKQVSDYVRNGIKSSQGKSLELPKGDLAIQNALEAVDPRDRTQFLLTADVAGNLYDYARHTEGSWNEARKMVKQMYPSVDTNAMKEIFDAAKEDKAIAETEGYGKVIKSGEKLDRGSLANAEAAVVPGRFTDQRVNKEGATLTEESLAKNIVSGFGINVILTDQAEVRDEKGNLLVNLGTEVKDSDGNTVLDEEGNPVIRMDNGAFIPSSNTLVINAGADATRTVTQTAVHELTHHIAVHAPDEYVKLSRYIMDAWYRKDPEGFTRAIKARQAAYKAQKGQVLSDEQALEEIIADGAADFDWADEDFVADVTTNEPTLASKIIDAIKDVLQKIRNILASGNVIDDRARDALYDKAVELDTVQAMWLKAAQTARKAQADQAVDEWQDEANRESRYSVGYHAGDLGKSTVDDYAHQGYSRGSGHFGFGTYFVGDEEQINYGNYGKRKHETVDFDKYKLFKPRDFGQALKLHDALRLVDGYITEYSDFNQYERFTPERSERSLNNTSRINRAAEELVSDYEWDEFEWNDRTLEYKEKVDKYIADNLDDYDRNELERKARQKYEEEQNKSVDENEVRKELAHHYGIYKDMKDFWGNPFIKKGTTEEEYVQKHLEDTIRIRTENKEIPYDFYYYSEAQNAIKDASEHWEWKDKKLGDLSFDLQVALGFRYSEERIIDALKETERIVSGYKSDPNQSRLDAEPGLDSGATVFMKQLGYEGIDVRHIREMDNTGYGSVIYDLKDEDLARKQEIGTARFSINAPNYTQEEMDAHRQALVDEVSEYYDSPYTDNYAEAGFVFPDGQMLRMGMGGQRAEDHRIASHAYDDISDREEALNSFINEGNIRWMPEMSTMEFGAAAEPTAEQYEWIRNVARNYSTLNGMIRGIREIDFTDADGETIESKLVSNKSADAIINDIKRFYKTGTTEGGSQLSQFRFSITPQQDADYMKAVESGDMETAQRMVDEAARMTGFDTDVYHGTTDFGFTQIKTSDLESKSDGGYYEWSPFFATDSLAVAQTYSSQDEIKRISEAVEPLDEEKFYDEYDDAVNDLVAAINSFANVYNYMDYTENPFTAALDELVNTSHSANDIVGELNDYVIGDMISDIAWAQAKDEYDQRPDESMDVSDYADWLAEGPDADTIWVKFDIVADMLRAFDGSIYGNDAKGNYALKANTNNMMRVDAKGHRWNDIPFDSIPEKRGYYRTRELAEIARDEGYDGIQISNLFDDGGKGHQKQKEPAAIYIFFKPESQVRSGDPVTYDDSGNVIPLSERFNQENPDIRWSVSPEQIEKAEADIGPMVRFSTPTYREIQPKAIYKSGVGFADYFKDASGRDLTYEWTKNNFSKEQADAVVAYLDKMAEWFEQSGEGSLRARYRFIGWDDLTDASVQVKTNDAGEIVGVTVSAMVKNGEYPVNFDLTTVCNKREGITNVIKNLIDKKVDGESVLHSIKLTDENMWKINQALKKENIDTACLGCFVEARRYYAQRFMDKIEDKWNKAVRQARKELGLPENEFFDFAKGRAVTGEEWSSIDSLWTAYDESTESKSSPADRIKILMDEIVKNKDVNSPYLKQIRISDILTPEGINGFKQLSNKGHDMVKTIKSIYGTSAPKEILAFTPYNSEIALLPTEMKGLPTGEYLKSIGGIRVQSFSDFKIAHVFEHFQMVADEAARDFYTHGYSKVIAFPRIFGLTGRKINMSVMFDVLNNKAWSQALGIPVRKAAKYAKKYQGLQFVKELPKENKDNRPYKEVEIEGVHGYLTYLVSDADYVNSIFGREYRKNIEAGMSEDEARRKANESKPYEQSINYREAVELENQDGYKENVGIIAVAYGDEHLKMLLSDPNVRYIIPYHKSGLPTFISKKTALAIARDYTNFQNTNIAESWKDKNGKDIDLKKEYAAFRKDSKSKYPAIDFFKQLNDNKYKVKFGSKTAAEKASMAGTADFDVYEPLETAKDIREVSNAYLEHCIENGWCPIFHEFAGDPNYYKVLFDFAVTDGTFNNIYPQRTVRNRYPGLDIDAKVAAGEQITDEDLVELKKAVEMGAETENRKNMTMAQNMPNVMNDILTRGSENSIIDDTNLNSIRWDTPDYTDVKLGNKEMTPAEEPGDIRRSIAVNFDDAYMDAVESDDMTEAQRLVDEAAKTAGFDTPLLHHGTPSFGFTTFDLARGENIIFATNNRLTAETYSGETDRSRISEKSKIDIDHLYGQALLDEAKKHLSQYKDYRLMAGPEKEDLLESDRAEMKAIAQDASNFIEENKDAFNDEKLALANRIVDAINKISSAWAADMVDSAYEEYWEADYELMWMDESIQKELLQAIGPSSVDIVRRRMSDLMYAGDLYVREGLPYQYIFDNQLALELGAELNKGIYGLYGNPGKQLVIDANGSNWNQIIPPDELELYGPQRTRSIAEAAKAKGYDSVLFKDLRDNGGATAYNGESDVYMFFNPSQVKSADPVTYREDGSVIPLSERFDPANNDIRYSMPTVDADGEILTDGQMEYFKNSQARDEQGRLLVLYHYSNALFESFDPDLLGTTSGDLYPNTAYGFFVTDDKEFSQQFGENEYKLYANFKNPIIHPYGASYKYSDEECEAITRRWLEVIDPEQFDYYEELREDDPDLTLYDYYMDLTSPGESPFEYADYDRKTLEEAGFDAVEIIEGIRDGADKPTTSYALFNREQPKFVDNANPTDAPEMRFSIPSEREVTNYALDKAESTSDIWYTDPVLQEGRVRFSTSSDDFINRITSDWNETWETRGRILDTDSVKTDVRSLVKTIMKNSEVDKQYDADVTDQATDAVKVIYNLFKSGKLEDAARYAWDAAEDIVKNVEYVDDEMYQKYKGVITYLADTKIAAPAELIDDPEFSEFVTENLAKFLVKKRGEDIRNVYTHLNKSWPKMFPKLDHPVDMFLQISEVMDAIQPYTEAYSSEEAAKLTEETAAALVEIAKSGEAYRSAADIMTPIFDRRTKAMKQRHREALKNVRNRRDELLSEEKEKRARQKERADKWKEKYNARVQKDAEKRKERKQRQMHKKLYDSVLKEYKSLTDRLLKPSKDRTKNIPEQLRQPLAEMLAAFDLEKERSKELEEKYRIPTRTQINFRQIKDALESIVKEEGAETEFDVYLNYIGDKITALADKMDAIGEYTIDALDVEDIDTIQDMLTGIDEAIKNWHQLEIDGEKYQAQKVCDDVGEGAKDHQKLYGKAKEFSGPRRFMDNIMNMGELTPIYFFRQIKGIYDMYRQLRKGFDSYVQNEKVIIDKLSGILSPYYKKNKKGARTKGSTIEEWRHSESAETFDLTYGSIRLTVAQKMSLYCLAKREGALAHMYSDNGGIVASEITPGSKMHKAEEMLKGKEIQVEHLTLTPADVDEIITTLTEDQKSVADQLQKLMSEDMSEIGNKTSMKLIGIRMYKEKDYFPIKVQGDSRGTNLDKIGMREKVRNPGFSNPLQDNATNPIVIDDIFSVVASHCNEMNMYAAYAVPLTNFMKVYNGSVINDKGVSVKIKEVLRQTYGDKAIQYIENFLDDINGNSFRRKGGLDDVLDKAIGQAKKAAVFANLRVALQQPTAIIRALAVMNPKYFAGVHPSRKATQEMFEHCPIALWKSWGYYDTHFGRDIEDVMMGEDVPSKISFWMSEIYGTLDNMTWGMIWQAVKKEVDADIKAKGLKVEKGSQEYWDMVNERASFVFDTTQVVDSPFHRSNDMRSKDRFTKQMTSFMAEPTLSFNMLRQGIVDAYEAIKKGEPGKATKTLLRVAGVWGGQALAVALAQTFVDALRRKGHKKKDDDEDATLTWYQEFMKYFSRNFSQNFWDDANPINNVYWFKDFVPGIVNALKGEYVFGQSNLAFQWYDAITSGIQKCKKKWEKGDEDSNTWYDCLTELLGGVGYIAGLPVKTVMRGSKNALHWFNKITGMTVFADDGRVVDKTIDSFLEKVKSNKEEPESGGLFDSIARRMGYQKAGSSDVGSKTTSEGSVQETDSADIESDVEEYRNSLSDNFSEEEKDELVKQYEKRIKKGVKSAEEQEKRDYDTMLFDAEKAAAGLEGAERDTKIWQSVSKGYKAYVEEGNYERIEMMRRVVEEAGGDVDYFDKQVNQASKSALKKSIKPMSEMTEEEYYAQKKMLGHLKKEGVSDQEISDYIYKTDTRTDLQVAMRVNDEDAIFEELTALVNAGFTQESFEKAYKNRNRVNLKNYKDKGGKYADLLKSTGTFIWPVDGYMTITSKFGPRAYVGPGASRVHPAIDIGCPNGTPISAADGGVVIVAGWNGGYGNSVGIKHDNGMVTYYNHLSDFNVKVGDTVAQGQQIAASGNTGTSYGGHLDFKVLDADGNAVDPEKYLDTSGASYDLDA